MTQARSAGVLLHRRAGDGIDVLLVLPGGPYWHARDEGAWQMPKGAIEPGETAEQAAVRELQEELGVALTETPVYLCAVRQAGGKHVEAYGIELDWDVTALVSNEVEIEWPPRSGKRLLVPEVAEARWFPLADAQVAMLRSQRPILAALAESLGIAMPDAGFTEDGAGRRRNTP